jgi:hypothetical protein
LNKRNYRALYQLKVTLRDIDPPVWRRIQFWEDTTLRQLHDILQIIMGWEDYHLHEFQIGRRVYSIPDPDDEIYERKVIDERRVRLRDVVSRVGTSFEYVYDFGDDWRHDLLLEAILMPEGGQAYPHCIAGGRNAPPEDAGGPPGYAEYLQAMADPEHEGGQQMPRWRGPFDPEAFSLDAVNRQLHKKYRRRTAAAARLQREPKSAADHASELLASMKALLAASGVSHQSRKRIRAGEKVLLRLSSRERELILKYTFAESELVAPLLAGNGRRASHVYGFTVDDLEELAGYVAAEANHAKDRKVQKELHALHEKISALLDAVDDEES